MITIEDLVEEIVGEINDEHDDDTAPLFDLNGDGTATAEARLEVEDLEDITGDLRDEDDLDEVDTLAVLSLPLREGCPGRGEIIRHEKGIEFEVLDGNPRRVNLIRIHGL